MAYVLECDPIPICEHKLLWTVWCSRGQLKCDGTHALLNLKL